MSLILDALRKSERSRQQTLTGQVSAADTPPARARIPVPWATLIGILLIANAVVLAIIFWRNHAHVAAPVAVEARIPAVTTPSAPAYHPEIRSLAAEAGAINATGAATTVATPVKVAPQKALTTTASTAIPAKTPLPVSGASAPLTSPIGNGSAAAVPPLESLPLAFQQSLPPLHLDVYGYVQSPAGRFVVINMQRYQAGDTLKEGPKVLTITFQGVILEYNGQKFLLPRP